MALEVKWHDGSPTDCNGHGGLVRQYVEINASGLSMRLCAPCCVQQEARLPKAVLDAIPAEGRRVPPPEAMNGYADQFGGEDYPTFTAKPDEDRRVPREAPARVLSVFMYPDPACRKCDGLGVRAQEVSGLIGQIRVRVVCDCVDARRKLAP